MLRFLPRRGLLSVRERRVLLRRQPLLPQLQCVGAAFSLFARPNAPRAVTCDVSSGVCRSASVGDNDLALELNLPAYYTGRPQLRAATPESSVTACTGGKPRKIWPWPLTPHKGRFVSFLDTTTIPSYQGTFQLTVDFNGEHVASYSDKVCTSVDFELPLGLGKVQYETSCTQGGDKFVLSFRLDTPTSLPTGTFNFGLTAEQNGKELYCYRASYPFVRGAKAVE